MRAFQKGADGVYVAGCLEGDCHFKTGNIKAAHRVAYVKKLLDEVRIGGDRLEMITMSAGMGERFAQTAIAFTEKIRKMGPNPIKSGSSTAERKAAG
jgi:coenzyme F420-reducing hydrogenase delta subunit